jgi:hypothetical protein
MRTNGIAAAFAVFFALTLAHYPASALDVVQAEMEPLDLEIENQNLILGEIERQAQGRVQYLSAWIQWWTKIKEMATETGDKLKKNYDQRIANTEKAAAILAQLYAENVDQQRHIPHVGWQNAATMAQLINTIRQELQGWAKLIADGKANWHIAAVGWITGEGIQAVIDGLQKQVQDINQGVRDGTWSTHVGGIGWVTGAEARAKIAAALERKAHILKLISDGDYEVVIPGLGPRTRKRLDAEIADAERELERRRTAIAKGEVTIHHPLPGWMNLNQLRASLQSGQQAYDVMKTTVSDGVYTVWVVEFGWAKRIDLENKVKELEATIATVQAALARGEYRAETPIGWVTQKEAEAAIESISKQLANPALDQAGRDYLNKQLQKAQKALAEIQTVSAYDLAILALEKAKFEGFVTGVMKLARPDFEKRELERAELEKIIAEYPIETALSVKQAQAWLDRLRKAREWIPG